MRRSEVRKHRSSSIQGSTVSREGLGVLPRADFPIRGEYTTGPFVQLRHVACRIVLSGAGTTTRPAALATPTLAIALTSTHAATTIPSSLTPTAITVLVENARQGEG